MQTGSLSDNDMSMIELLRIFYQNKGLIILSTLLGIVIGCTIIFFSHPVYEAKIRLTAATEGEIAGFNQGRSWDRSPLKPLKMEDVHLSFSTVLLSQTAKDDFYKQFYLPALSAIQKKNYSQEKLYAKFSKDFSIVANPMTALDSYVTYTVAIRGTNAQQVTLWLNQFVNAVKEQTTNIIINDMKKQNDVLISNLSQQIDIARSAAKAYRLDRITQLKEKLKTIKLAKAQAPFWDDEPAVMNDATEFFPMDRDVVQAEIRNLQARKSDDAFASNLRELQAKLEFYKSLKVDPNHVAVFHMDGLIETPTSPIAPKKKLILMVSLVLGFMAGAFYIMLPLAWRKEKFRVMGVGDMT